jgi:tetratricopeptide (TPR) repeat protein
MGLEHPTRARAWTKPRTPCVAAFLALSLGLVSPATVVAANPGAPGVTLGVGIGVSGAFALAPSEEDMDQAKAEYETGKKAYRLGQFDEAALSFESAYEKSGLPDILYNIGLSHMRWYDVDPNIGHLRKARVVFQNYVIEIQKNPDLGDLEEAEELINQIDAKIAEHEDKASSSDGGGGGGGGGGDDGGRGGGGGPIEPIDHGPDPGNKLRLGGYIAMGVGGAFVLGGIVSGVVLGLKGQEFEENLANAYASRTELGCTTNDPRPECDQINNEIDVYRSNGRSANGLAVGLGITFGGLGVAGIVTGAVLFIQGNKKTKAWEQRQLSVAPTWGGDSMGLAFSGRF